MKEPLVILVIGSGGSESALCWLIGRNHPERHVLCTPGNGGISPKNRRDVKDSDLNGIVKLAKEEKADLVVVRPEGPLVAGLADRLRENGIPAFGPGAIGAQLEGRKIYTKQLCDEVGIPTARWQWADDYEQAKKIICSWGVTPPVVKANGLCGGKGVTVAETEEQALEAAYRLFKKVQGNAGARILMEERLVGRECSVQTFCDGENAEVLPVARDYKRAFDGNKGPNTGGMGSYSPLPDVSNEDLADIKTRIIMPTLRGMAEERGAPYQGLLYAGIILTRDGPKLLEYNVRFGDPETQVVLPLIESDIVEYMFACNKLGGLAKLGPLKVKNKFSVCIVLASDGYPGKYQTGFAIRGLKNVPRDVSVFHAGTNRVTGNLVTSGGRVMSIVGLGSTIEQARQRAEVGADAILFANKFCREDIAMFNSETLVPA
jgi:phosphoribosylamine--glycine ligase